MAGSTSGKIPEYTAADVNKWLGDQASNVSNVTEIVLTWLPVLGFVIFCAGLVQLAREERESAGAMMGSSTRRYGWWMVVGGGAMAIAGIILLLLIGFFRPATA